MKEFKEVGKIK